MNVLLTGAFKYTAEQLDRIEKSGYDITYVQDERETLKCDPARFDCVVCNGLFLYNDIKKFTNLKFIQATSAGLDRLPLDYIKERNIALYNARGVYSVPMAEFAVMSALNYCKNAKFFLENQKNKSWTKNRELRELTDSTVLILGTGSVGQECAKHFSAFTDNIFGIDLFTDDKEYFTKIYPLEKLNTMLSLADIVIITLPLTDETKYLINKNSFEKMKKDAFLINISRGGVVNTDDLIEALNNKEVGGAALDVFETEPLDENSPLWDMENVFITPHNSFVSNKNADRLFGVIYKNLKAFQEGEENR